MVGDVAVQDPVSDPQHGGGGEGTEIHIPNNITCTAFSSLLSLPSSLLFMLSTNSQLTVAICVYH